MPKIQVDKGKILRGNPIPINDFITIYQHTIGEVLDFGEQQFLTTFHTMCSAPWDMPSMLDDMGIFFMDITDWECFVMMRSVFTKDSTSILLGDLDISSFQAKPRLKEGVTEETPENERFEIILEDETGHIIDENVYRILMKKTNLTNHLYTIQ